MEKRSTSIAENIRFLREKKGYSQEYMSEMLSISQQTYSLAEKHPEKVNLGRVREIAKILDVKVSFLLNEDESFVLNSFSQQGGNTTSLVQTLSSEDAFLKVIKQLESENAFLRGLIEKTAVS